MKLIVNGQYRELADEITGKQLLSVLGLPGTELAIEHNGEIVAAEAFEGRVLRDNDRLELIRFMGGG